MNKHTILLVGQNGIIGSFLFDKLNSENEITGIGKGPFNSQNYFNIDLLNRNEVKNFVKSSKKFDALIFLVGLAHAKGKNKEYPVFEKINLITLLNLLEMLEKENKIPKKIIFSSTISVYGEKIDKDIYKEEDILSPSTPYAKTKILAEQYLKQNYKEKSWILRFAPVYSEKFKLNIERRTLIKGKRYKVGDGKNKLSLLNIKNISMAIKEILNDHCPSGTYNLADSTVYSFNDLLAYSNGVNKVFTIPKVVPKLAFFAGRLTKNIFLQENSIKLLTDNIFSTERLEKYIKLPHSLISQ